MSYGFKILVKLGVRKKNSKSKHVGRFLIFQTKLQVLSWFFLFLSKKRQFFEIFLKVPSLARFVPKPLKVLVNDEMMIRFWSFIFLETYICYRVYLNLNCYIGKKVQKIFLMGLKIWWSWGSGFFFFKITAGRTVFKFSCKTLGFELVFSLFV